MYNILCKILGVIFYMSGQVTLKIIQGKLRGQQHLFKDRTTCIIGRSSECNLKLPDDFEHNTVSRYHCLLDINPPCIKIRDFGSLNGTYVNGVKIGQRDREQTPEQVQELNFPEYDLQNQDKIQLGNTIFEVEIEYPPAEVNISLGSDSARVCAGSPNFLEIIGRWLSINPRQQDPDFPVIQGYEVVKLLGKGAFGEVYLAREKHTGELIAIKVLLPIKMEDERTIRDFLREAENTKALTHENIVQFKNYGYFEGLLLLMMEYCNGGSLAGLMKKNGGKLSVEVALPIILQVLDGLIYTHCAEIPNVKLGDGRIGKGKGLVHRDLKPANILLTQVNGRVVAKIADYGLAKAFDLAGLSGHSLTGVKAGSPGFMCRQQLLNFKYVQPEVDVWAVAASLYNMLTGTYPRNFTKDPLLSILENQPVPIRERDENIPQILADVIDLALVEKPQIHFRSAIALKRALEFVYNNQL